MQFKDIIGNYELKNQLINSVENNRLSHSQLFLGNPGGSKLAIAIAFAQYINCTRKTTSDSCGECQSCVKYNRLTHPDLHLVFPVLSIHEKGIKMIMTNSYHCSAKEKKELNIVLIMT